MKQKEKFTVVVFSGELDRAWAALGLAITAASMAMEVTMVFTFWGLNIVKKNEDGINGNGLMKKMKDANMPSIDEMIARAKEMGVKFVVCTSTWKMMELDEADFRSEVDCVSGTASWLGEAAESKLALFI